MLTILYTTLDNISLIISISVNNFHIIIWNKHYPKNSSGRLGRYNL